MKPFQIVFIISAIFGIYQIIVVDSKNHKILIGIISIGLCLNCIPNVAAFFVGGILWITPLILYLGYTLLEKEKGALYNFLMTVIIILPSWYFISMILHLPGASINKLLMIFPILAYVLWNWKCYDKNDFGILTLGMPLAVYAFTFFFFN